MGQLKKCRLYVAQIAMQIAVNIYFMILYQHYFAKNNLISTVIALLVVHVTLLQAEIDLVTYNLNFYKKKIYIRICGRIQDVISILLEEILLSF